VSGLESEKWTMCHFSLSKPLTLDTWENEQEKSGLMMSDAQKGPPSELLRLEQQLCFTLYVASRATIAIYRPLLDELEITYPQYLVLSILWEGGTCSVKEIGQLLRLDSGTLSPLLKRLEATGLITRQRRANDERVVDISLTSEGRDLQGQAAAIPEKVSGALDLPFEEYRRLMALLEQLMARLYAQERAHVQ